MCQSAGRLHAQSGFHGGDCRSNQCRIGLCCVDGCFQRRLGGRVQCRCVDHRGDGNRVECCSVQCGHCVHRCSRRCFGRRSRRCFGRCSRCCFGRCSRRCFGRCSRRCFGRCSRCCFGGCSAGCRGSRVYGSFVATVIIIATRSQQDDNGADKNVSVHGQISGKNRWKDAVM